MRRPPPVRGLLCIVGLLLGLSVSHPAHAYAWMIKHGFAKCNTCHTDPSGGETLNLVGRVEADALLSWGGEFQPKPTYEFLFGAIPEPPHMHLGASYRHLFTWHAAYEDVPSGTATFPMQLDMYGQADLDWFFLGGSLGVAEGIVGTAHVRGAQLNRETGEGFILLSRNHFVGVHIDDQTSLRAGRLNLPFGVRVPEHVLWAREGTRTDRESDQQHGIALAHSAGPLRLEAMVIAGNYQIYPDRYRERGYCLSAEYLFDNRYALGVSSLATRANIDRFTLAPKAVRQAHGLNSRLGLTNEWALLAEADVLKEGGRGWGYTGLLQSDYEPWRGLHFMLTGEVLDRGALDSELKVSAGNGKPRPGAWATIDWFFFSHFELRLDVVQRQGAALTTELQLHVFL